MFWWLHPPIRTDIAKISITILADICNFFTGFVKITPGFVFRYSTAKIDRLQSNLT